MKLFTHTRPARALALALALTLGVPQMHAEEKKPSSTTWQDRAWRIARGVGHALVVGSIATLSAASKGADLIKQGATWVYNKQQLSGIQDEITKAQGMCAGSSEDHYVELNASLIDDQGLYHPVYFDCGKNEAFYFPSYVSSNRQTL